MYGYTNKQSLVIKFFMNDGIPYADIIILALIAGFILLRLRSTLGQKTGRDEADFMQRFKPMAEAKEPIVQIIDKTLKNKQKDELDTALALISDDAVISALNAIKEKDTQFTATRFIDGARAAFEMVFEAFTKGDKQTLHMLLTESLAKDFITEIDARATQEKRPDTTLVSVVGKDIVQASLIGNMARITMKFTSEQITVMRNAKGEIVEGNPSATHHVVDEWVFERDVTSKNPNWKIIET
jgi:predicted lipid-binding transport protein (Tim44 family)